MTNRETMPGATGKIPKNADNKNESSRARSPASPVCPALVAGARWRRSSVSVSAPVSAYARRVLVAGVDVDVVVAVIVAASSRGLVEGVGGGGGGGGGDRRVVATVVVVRQKMGVDGGGWKKMQKPRRARRFVGGQYAAMNAYYIYL